MALVYETPAGTTAVVLVDPSPGEDGKPQVLARIRSTGPHAALGALHDQEYRMSQLREPIPEWLLTFLPAASTALGSAFLK